MFMFVTLITDCRDDNALGRSTTRLSTLFDCHIATVGVESDLEAAGNLIDILDAANGEKGVILVNVAPRHKEAKKWENGTPFGYFYYKNTLVVSSIDGLTLSLAKKFRLVDNINLVDIPQVLEFLLQKRVITETVYHHIRHTQFRSFEYLPRVARWILDGPDLPIQNYSVENIADIPNRVWWIDNFGNCKTTIMEQELNPKEKEVIETKIGKFVFYHRLKNVPDNNKAIISGSSGLEDKRFLEIVIQGKSAAKELGLKTGVLI